MWPDRPRARDGWESLRHDPRTACRTSARQRADALGVRANLPPLMSGAANGPSMTARVRLAAQEARGVTMPRIRRLAGTLRRKSRLARWSARAGGRVPCHFLQNHAFVTIQGEVAPCPMPGRPIAGDLHTASFSEIWNGEVLTAMRRGFIEGAPMDCATLLAEPRRVRPDGPGHGDAGGLRSAGAGEPGRNAALRCVRRSLGGPQTGMGHAGAGRRGAPARARASPRSRATDLPATPEPTCCVQSLASSP